MPADWPWMRFWAEARTDKKLAVLTDAQHRVWLHLLCFASEQPTRGEIVGIDEFELAVECASSDEVLLQETLAVLSRLRIVCIGDDAIRFLNWEKRQYDKPSDRPEATAERKRRSREKAVRHAKLPSNKEGSRAVTPSHAPEKEEELETEIEGEQNTPLTAEGESGSAEQRLEWVLGRVKSGKSTRRDPPPYVAQFEAFWHQVVRKEPSKKEAYWSWLQVLLSGEDPPGPEDVLAGLSRMVPVWDRFEDKTKIPHITTWLNQDRWTVEAPACPAPMNGHEPHQQTPEEIAEFQTWLKENQPA